MNTTQLNESTLEHLCATTVAANAAAVDRNGAFPKQSIEALAAAGLLGALSSTECGGLALGLPGAARIVRRVAEECGSTAMVLAMHYCGTAVLEAYGAERRPRRRRDRRSPEHARLQRGGFAQPFLGAREHGAAAGRPMSV